MARESTQHAPAPRVCAQCGGRLRRDNTNSLCDPCQRSAHTVELLAPVLPLDFWAEPEMRQASSSSRTRCTEVCSSARWHDCRNHSRRPRSRNSASSFSAIGNRKRVSFIAYSAMCRGKGR